MFHSRLLAILFILFAASAVAQAPVSEPAPAAEPLQESRTFDQVLEAKTLRVGVYLLTPNVMQGRDGDLVGADIDIAKRLAKDMGVSADFRRYEWDQLIPALQRGEVDILVAGLSITPERALQVWFSNPYASAGIGIATNTRLTASFESLDNLDHKDVAIGVIGGTVSEQVARELFEQASIKVFTEEKQAEEALVKGLLHGFIRAEPAPKFLALRYPKLIDVPLNKPLLATREAFAVRRGDAHFINFLNAWIYAREADAWLTSTHKYWFESLTWKDRVAQ